MAHQWRFRFPLAQEFTSAGLSVLRGQQVPDGQEWLVTYHSFEANKATSGGNTRARAFVERGTEKIPYTEQKSPAADRLYWDDVPIPMFPGDRFAVEWDNAQINTVAKAVYSGIATRIEEGG